MRILNQGVDSAKNDTQEIFEGLQAERSAALGQVRQLQLAARLLLLAESRRLAQRHPADMRLAVLATAERTVRERVAVLDTEQEVAAIRVPPVAKTDALVHGRITDDAARAAGRVTVTLVRADGSAVAGVKPVTVDDAGYYAFVLDPQVKAQLPADEKLSVAVQRGDATVVPSQAANFTLASGGVAVKDVALNDSELQKLQLRAKVAVAAPATAPATTVTKATTTRTVTPKADAKTVTKPRKKPAG